MNRMYCVAAALLLAGCAVGKDSVLFVTRTNVAIDFDAEPPTLDVGYKRDEMVLSPIDGQGRVLPVMTTVGVQASPLTFGANHSFATGNAAVILAKYLLQPNGPELGTGVSELTAATDRTFPAMNPLPGSTIEGKRTPYYFGTNTTLGLGVQWNAQTVPSSVALGYKRKELAFIPLGKVTMAGAQRAAGGGGSSETDDSSLGEGEVALASLIATAHSGAQVGSPSSTKAIVGQTFATGIAATYLASHPEVRQAIGPSVVPNYQDAVAALRGIEEARKLNAVRVDEKTKQAQIVDEIVKKHGTADDALKARIKQAAADNGIRWFDDKPKFGLVGSTDGEPETTKKLQKVLDTN